jgi:spermidine/putrescine transport system ATP-binding protein
MVFQSYALFPHLTVFNNVAFGLNMKKRPQTEIHQRVWEILRRVKLEELAERKPHQLSGGQQQRVALARAVVNKPAILLLDEPLSALDYKLRKAMQVELKSLQRQLGITFVLVTHDQEEALSMSDRVVILREGVIEQIGTPREVYERPRNLFVASFVGEINRFDGTVLTVQDQQTLLVDIEGFPCLITTDKRFQPGDTLKILLRPEDLRVEAFHPHQDTQGRLVGYVEEKIYKGATLDSHIVLLNGKQIIASEFFDEEHENLDHPLGEKVTISWVKSWEVVLSDDN